jgi:hypothetical protein
MATSKKTPDTTTPGLNHVDTWADTLAALETMDVGETLGPKLDAACSALSAVRKALWANQDAMVKSQSSSAYKTMAAGTDAASKNAVSTMNTAAMDSIAKNSDMDLADHAAMTVRDFNRGVELENAKAAAPAALTVNFDLASHVQRVEASRAVSVMGAKAAAEYHQVLLEAGDEKATVAFEIACESFMVDTVKGGSAALVAGNPTRYRLNPGMANEEIGAAASFLSLLTELRSQRAPQFLLNARDAVDQLKALSGALFGEHVMFMGSAARQSLYSGSSTARMPDPLKVDSAWATRYLKSGMGIPGWSRVEAKLSAGGVRRAPATLAADTSFGAAKYKY